MEKLTDLEIESLARVIAATINKKIDAERKSAFEEAKKEFFKNPLGEVIQQLLSNRLTEKFVDRRAFEEHLDLPKRLPAQNFVVKDYVRTALLDNNIKSADDLIDKVISMYNKNHNYE